MKSAKYLIAVLCTGCLFISCFGGEELYWTHLFGFAKLHTTEIGINGMVLKIGDIDPENPHTTRVREVTTGFSVDSLGGYFELDSVCYATSANQGSQIVWILVDSLDNPGYASQYQYIDLSGPTDTVDFIVIP